MGELRTIIVAMDFSPSADRALDVAIALAKPFAARVHVVHSMHLPTPVSMTGEITGPFIGVLPIFYCTRHFTRNLGHLAQAFFLIS